MNKESSQKANKYIRKTIKSNKLESKYPHNHHGHIFCHPNSLPKNVLQWSLLTIAFHDLMFKNTYVYNPTLFTQRYQYIFVTIQHRKYHNTNVKQFLLMISTTLIPLKVIYSNMKIHFPFKC